MEESKTQLLLYELQALPNIDAAKILKVDTKQVREFRKSTRYLAAMERQTNEQKEQQEQQQQILGVLQSTVQALAQPEVLEVAKNIVSPFKVLDRSLALLSQSVGQPQSRNYCQELPRSSSGTTNNARRSFSSSYTSNSPSSITGPHHYTCLKCLQKVPDIAVIPYCHHFFCGFCAGSMIHLTSTSTVLKGFVECFVCKITSEIDPYMGVLGLLHKEVKIEINPQNEKDIKEESEHVVFLGESNEQPRGTDIRKSIQRIKKVAAILPITAPRSSTSTPSNPPPIPIKPPSAANSSNKSDGIPNTFRLLAATHPRNHATPPHTLSHALPGSLPTLPIIIDEEPSPNIPQTPPTYFADLHVPVTPGTYPNTYPYKPTPPLPTNVASRPAQITRKPCVTTHNVRNTPALLTQTIVAGLIPTERVVDIKDEERFKETSQSESKIEGRNDETQNENINEAQAKHPQI